MVAYDPVELDRNIRRYVGIAERNLASLETIGEQIAPLLEKAALSDIESATIVYDRLVKAGLNLVKAIDELSRLRSFISGGPDSRPDLSAMGEIELRAVLIAGVRALGITDLKQLSSSPSSGGA